MLQIKKDLQMLQEDMQTLGKMNQVLFNSWQDQMAQTFSSGCVGDMARKWNRWCVNSVISINAWRNLENKVKAGKVGTAYVFKIHIIQNESIKDLLGI